MLQQFLADPLGPPFSLADLLGQPHSQFLRVVHRALAEPEELADLGAVVFHRAPVPLVKRELRRRDADLAPAGAVLSERSRAVFSMPSPWGAGQPRNTADGQVPEVTDVSLPARAACGALLERRVLG